MKYLCNMTCLFTGDPNSLGELCSIGHIAPQHLHVRTLPLKIRNPLVFLVRELAPCRQSDVPCAQLHDPFDKHATDTTQAAGNENRAVRRVPRLEPFLPCTLLVQSRNKRTCALQCPLFLGPATSAHRDQTFKV